MFCKKCGSKIDEDSSFCSYCGYNIGGNDNYSSPVEPTADNSYSESNNGVPVYNGISCPRCGSNDVQVQLVSVNKNRGCFTILFYVLLAITLIGIPIMILILILSGKKTEVTKHYVCQKCGYDFSSNNAISKSTAKIIIIIFVILSIALLGYLASYKVIYDAREASNLRSVEAYAKAIEYGVIQYEYKHDGALPKSYCDVKPYISYTNEEVVCDVEIDDDSANVTISHCKVGSYEKHSYRYDGTLKTENRGAEVEDETEFGYPESCY